MNNSASGSLATGLCVEINHFSSSFKVDLLPFYQWTNAPGSAKFMLLKNNTFKNQLCNGLSINAVCFVKKWIIWWMQSFRHSLSLTSELVKWLFRNYGSHFLTGLPDFLFLHMTCDHIYFHPVFIRWNLPSVRICLQFSFERFRAPCHWFPVLELGWSPYIRLLLRSSWSVKRVWH